MEEKRKIPEELDGLQWFENHEGNAFFRVLKAREEDKDYVFWVPEEYCTLWPTGNTSRTLLRFSLTHPEKHLHSHPTPGRFYCFIQKGRQ